MKVLTYLIFTVLAVLTMASCKKEKIAPENQMVTFVKKYGHVGTQRAVDLKTTDDGGFIMVGNSDSYTAGAHNGMLLIKADSMGNEEWSVLFKELDTDTMAYNVEAAKVIILPGEGYLVVGNRDYIQILDGVERLIRTKVVLYKVDFEGALLLTEPIVLEEEDANTSTWVNDAKIDTFDGSNYSVILVGKTTNIRVNKGSKYQLSNKEADKLDIYACRLDADLTVNSGWITTGYGYGGEDIAHSVHITADGRYLITGISQYEVSVGKNVVLREKIIVVVSQRSTFSDFAAAPLFDALADESYKSAYSSYDPASGAVTIFGHTITNTSSSSLYILPCKNIGGSVGLVSSYIDFNDKTFSAATNVRGVWDLDAVSIESLNDGGYILSATNTSSVVDSEIAVFRLDDNFDILDGWPVYLGVQDNNAVQVGSFDYAGKVLPLYKNIEGTEQQELSAFAVNATFGTGTNSMIGLMKINANGSLSAQ